ncbi:MAG: hypothetical protein GXX96_07100 [Planctomycetaceae bacterium]|nr:hypothetical protein [Planctomycetaceae bacterium]
MTPDPLRPAKSTVVAEIALVFLVFFVHGAWPVPEVNEPYYIGKAIHFWNPQWIPDDPFLNSSDTHTTFYLSLGWLALFLPPTLIAWGGRLITWALLAWSWQRLSRAVLPRRWASVWTAALFVCLMEHGHMAGEWVIGGVEAKGFAYVLTFLGLETLARGRFNLVWPLLGAAAAFHVLVGGWAVAAAGVAWLLIGKDRPALLSMVPSLVLGLLLSLPGLIPSLALTRGTDPDAVAFANQIYVFQRLGHHLDPAGFPPGFALRFVLLSIAWAAMWYYGPRSSANNRIQAFVTGTLVLSLMGVAIAIIFAHDPARAAGLLRFYWFRLSDVAVPMGVALAGPVFLLWISQETKRSWPHDQRAAMIGSGVVVLGLVLVLTRLIVKVCTMAQYWLTWEAAAGVAAAVVVGGILYVEKRILPIRHLRQVRMAALGALSVALLLLAPAAYVTRAALARLTPVIPRADRVWDYWAWKDACLWIADSGEVPADARFLTPLMGQTFKWYAQRSEVISWKDVPQDAESIVRWWNCAVDIYKRDDVFSGRGLNDSLNRVDSRRLRYLGEKHGASYLITFRWPRKREFRVLYENRSYIVYRMDLPPAPPAWLNPEDGSADEPPADFVDEPIDRASTP